MISAVNPYLNTSYFSQQGFAAYDYMALDLVIRTSTSLTASTREFIYSFNPHKLYLNVKNINNKAPEAFISTYA